MKVDWDFVGTVARTASGDPPGMITPSGMQERADEAAEHVLAATGMTPLEDIPPLEWVTRGQWIDANIATMRTLLDPVIARAPVPKGASSFVGTLGMGAVALEIGGLLGMFSRRVLGQLEINLLDPSRPPRLLMVGPNLESAPERMGVDRERFITWVLLHEMTHAVQFTSVPWLREELGGGMERLLELAEIKPDPMALLKIRGAELRAAVGAVREGGLLGAVAGPEKRALMMKIQGTMGLVEGHAEWAMDVAGDRAIDDVESLRSAMTERRGSRPPVLKILDRLLGFDMKLKQYEQGKAFCDAVAAERGNDGLLQAWASVDDAPTPAELADPRLWLTRVPV
jgi:coenzyme F420 biosynthesis associated uncharacterized protein